MWLTRSFCNILQFSVFTLILLLLYPERLFYSIWLNYFLKFEQSIDALETTDAAINIELTVLGNRLSELNTTVAGLDGRVAQLEVSGIILWKQQINFYSNRFLLISYEFSISNWWRMHQILTGTVAFQVELDEYTSIPVGMVVLFDIVHLNIANGWVASCNAS